MLDYILQRVILCVADRLAPLVAAVLAGNLNGDMAEPAVGLRTVPVLDIRRNGDDIADAQTLRGLALLLIPALAVNTDEQLSAAALRVVDVPVVAAARLKGDVREKHRLSGNGQRLEEAAAGEILRIRVVRLAEAEEAAVRFNGVVVA